ncbi:MAG: Gfo/Idh/MocA family oxidoreductase [Herpetosiphonaceae bacterium]|nr:Gfo/Idh/MocA family oxidoreductase [Herpetosiphonaceae bacterium]
MSKFKIAGINFAHQHMGDNLRMAFEHPDVEIVGLSDEDPQQMETAVRNFGIPADRVFNDYRQCLEQTKPDLVMTCPATAEHALWVERIAPYDVHLLVEKPFAASLPEADRMIKAVAATGKRMAINWPLAWYPPHVTSKRLIDESLIGEVIEVHYYDGNRGPVRHAADKIETMPTAEEKAASWFYQRDKGGGSLLDYLGYGTTLATWFNAGQAPLEVMAVTDEPAGLEVDEHSIVVARYACGLSKFETRWGAFTDPWIMQPQPKCGFVIVGSVGTISSYDYEPTIRVQTAAHPEGQVIPVDQLQQPRQNPVQYMLHCIQTGEPIQGPLDPAICRIGQQIVDSAILSAHLKRTVPLVQ